MNSKLKWPQVWRIFSLFLLLFSLSLGVRFYSYKKFVSKNQFREFKVVAQYRKKSYWVLKLKDREVSFYTTTRDDIKNLLNRVVEAGVVTKKVSFLEYLTTFYAPTFRLGVVEQPLYEEFVVKQHSSQIVSNIFQALFFGDSLSYEIRQKLSTLGISHLLALSGFHLGIISGIIYLLFSPIYNFFPPYRNRNIEIGVIVLIILFLYLYFTNFPPSLVRSYFMELVAFLFAFYLKPLLNFELLLLVVVISIILFPSFITSVGFFLSVMGVFLIFLYFKLFSPSLITTFLLPFYLYIAMFPIVHYFFTNFNYYQLLSPFVTLLFTLLYPLEIVLHFFGIGGILDSYIIDYLNLGGESIEISVSSSIFYGYLLSLLWIFSKLNKRIIF